MPWLMAPSGSPGCMELSVSKILGILAYAGDKAAGRAIAVSDLSAACVAAILHNDRSMFADTLRDLPKGKRAASVRVTLPALDTHLAIIRTARTAAPLGEGADASAVSFAASVAAIVATHADVIGAAVAAEPKARKAHAEPLQAFGAAMAEAWAKATDELSDGAAEAAKAARKAAKDAAEAKAAEEAAAAAAKAAESQVMRVDGEVDVAALIDEANTLQVERDAAIKRAELAEAARDAAVAEANTLRAELAARTEELAAVRALLASMEAAKVAAPARGRKAKAAA